MNPRSATIQSLVILALVHTALGPSPAGAADRPLRIVLPRAPSSLDPHLEPTAVADAIFGNVFEGLIEVKPDGTLAPALAVHWQRVGDRSWRFELRQGVSFHDGRAFSADDVTKSIERACAHTESVSRVLLDTIAEATAEDAHTVRVDLNKPDALILRKLAFTAIVPGDAPEEITDPIGTGPYRVLDSDPGTSLTMAAVPDHWRLSPRLPQVEFIFEADREASLARLSSGEVDLVTDLPPELVGAVEGNPDLWVESALGGLVHILGLNSNLAPFEDPALREAVDFALDREDLAREVFHSYCRPAGQLVNEMAHGFAPHLKPVEHHANRARALLLTTESSQVPFTLEFKEGKETLAEAVQRQLAAAGFQVELQPRPWSELLPRILEGEVQAVLFSWRSTRQDVGFLFDLVVHSESPIHAPLGYSSPHIDRLIAASRTTLDPALRLELLYSAAERISLNRSLLPLAWGMDLYAVRRDLSWSPPASGTIDLQTISFYEAGRKAPTPEQPPAPDAVVPRS